MNKLDLSFTEVQLLWNQVLADVRHNQKPVHSSSTKHMHGRALNDDESKFVRCKTSKTSTMSVGLISKRNPS